MTCRSKQPNKPSKLDTEEAVLREFMLVDSGEAGKKIYRWHRRIVAMAVKLGRMPSMRLAVKKWKREGKINGGPS